jgi:hypothetical protein
MLTQGLCIRVQWFWQFFRISICFMCFWFGLEILRLVYKKAFLKYWMVTISFCPPKKVPSLKLGKREKIRTWKIEKKIVFLRKNLWELLDARVLHIIEISAKFCFFWYPLRPISKKFFSTLKRDGTVFLEVKRSKKIETAQYFKKRFFIN